MRPITTGIALPIFVINFAWFPGYPSEMEYFTERKTAIAIQFNTDDIALLKRAPRAYVGEIARIVFGEPPANSARERSSGQ